MAVTFPEGYGVDPEQKPQPGLRERVLRRLMYTDRVAVQELSDEELGEQLGATRRRQRVERVGAYAVALCGNIGAVIDTVNTHGGLRSAVIGGGTLAAALAYHVNIGFKTQDQINDISSELSMRSDAADNLHQLEQTAVLLGALSAITQPPLPQTEV